MVTWQTDRGTLGPSFLYHEHGKNCLRLIVRQIVRLRVRLRRVHKACISPPDIARKVIRECLCNISIIACSFFWVSNFTPSGPRPFLIHMIRDSCTNFRSDTFYFYFYLLCHTLSLVIFIKAY